MPKKRLSPTGQANIYSGEGASLPPCGRFAKTKTMNFVEELPQGDGT
jgi:hypothetical protein